MGILALVIAVLVVSYASSTRAYLQQRSRTHDLEQQIAQSEADIAGLQREKKRWRDDAYVQAQARQRFGWVLPGETSYQVLDADGKPMTRAAELTDPGTIAAGVPTPWWEKVQRSVAQTDHPPKAPTPATTITPPPRPRAPGAQAPGAEQSPGR